MYCLGVSQTLGVTTVVLEIIITKLENSSNSTYEKWLKAYLVLLKYQFTFISLRNYVKRTHSFQIYVTSFLTKKWDIGRYWKYYKVIWKKKTTFNNI